MKALSILFMGAAILALGMMVYGILKYQFNLF